MTQHKIIKGILQGSIIAAITFVSGVLLYRRHKKQAVKWCQYE